MVDFLSKLKSNMGSHAEDNSYSQSFTCYSEGEKAVKQNSHQCESHPSFRSSSNISSSSLKNIWSSSCDMPSFAEGGEVKAQAKKLANMGRDGDTELVHVNKDEETLLKAYGGRGSINPKTGLREYPCSKHPTEHVHDCYDCNYNLARGKTGYFNRSRGLDIFGDEQVPTHHLNSGEIINCSPSFIKGVQDRLEKDADVNYKTSLMKENLDKERIKLKEQSILDFTYNPTKNEERVISNQLNNNLSNDPNIRPFDPDIKKGNITRDLLKRFGASFREFIPSEALAYVSKQYDDDTNSDKYTESDKNDMQDLLSGPQYGLFDKMKRELNDKKRIVGLRSGGFDYPHNPLGGHVVLVDSIDGKKVVVNDRGKIEKKIFDEKKGQLTNEDGSYYVNLKDSTDFPTVFSVDPLRTIKKQNRRLQEACQALHMCRLFLFYISLRKVVLMKYVCFLLNLIPSLIAMDFMDLVEDYKEPVVCSIKYDCSSEWLLAKGRIEKTTKFIRPELVAFFSNKKYELYSPGYFEDNLIHYLFFREKDFIFLTLLPCEEQYEEIFIEKLQYNIDTPWCGVYCMLKEMYDRACYLNRTDSLVIEKALNTIQANQLSNMLRLTLLVRYDHTYTYYSFSSEEDNTKQKLLYLFEQPELV
jgi:hypothetical protein